MMPRASRALRSLACLVLVLWLAGCSVLRGSSVAPPDRWIDLPASWCGDLILVSVDLADGSRSRLLLDTGASTSVVTPELAARLGPVEPLEHEVTAAEGDIVQVAGASRLVGARCGEWRLPEVRVLVLDLKPVSEALHTRVDGVLGWPAFRDVLLRVDGPGRRVCVGPGALPPSDGLRTLHLSGRFLPHVQLRTPDGWLRVLLDTGSAGSVDLLEWPSDAFVVEPRPWFRSVTLSGLGPRRTIARPRVDAELGAFRLEDPVVSLTTGTQRIGARVLREFDVLFDARNLRVRLERDAADAGSTTLRVEQVRGTGALMAGLGREWKVWDIVPGSPADEAGLRIGDVVVAVEDKPVDSIDVLCPAPPAEDLPTSQRVRVRRGDALVELVLPIGVLVP